jgi:repressor LexA
MFAFFQNLVYAFPMTNPKSKKKSSPSEKVSELPDGPANEHGLTPRQAKILDVIRTAIETNGYPPSMREIGQAAGLASPASVSYQLETLVEKGFIRRDATKGRALEITYPSEGEAITPEKTRNVPLLGSIAAGSPILAEQSFDEVFPLPESLVGKGDIYMLKVKGDYEHFPPFSPSQVAGYKKK